MGSCLWAPLTYIGNAPNFMVKAIAEQQRCQCRLSSVIDVVVGVLIPAVSTAYADLLRLAVVLVP